MLLHLICRLRANSSLSISQSGGRLSSLFKESPPLWTGLKVSLRADMFCESLFLRFSLNDKEEFSENISPHRATPRAESL